MNKPRICPVEQLTQIERESLLFITRRLRPNAEYRRAIEKAKRELKLRRANRECDNGRV